MWLLLFGLLLAADASMLEGETYESFNEATDANMVELETYEPINEGSSHGKHIHGAQHTMHTNSNFLCLAFYFA